VVGHGGDSVGSELSGNDSFGDPKVSTQIYTQPVSTTDLQFMRESFQDIVFIGFTWIFATKRHCGAAAWYFICQFSLTIIHDSEIVRRLAAYGRSRRLQP